MNYKFKTTLFFLAIGSIALLSSCKDDEETAVTPETAAPTISEVEIGEGNSMECEPGGDLHMDAEIVAEGKIDKITVDLHPESGEGDDIEAEYTEYSGLLNADFHQDLEIPSTTEHGDYHFHMTVTDQAGKSTSIEADVHIH
jgi:hypothetical protein